MKFAWLDGESFNAGVDGLEVVVTSQENASLYFWFKILKMGGEGRTLFESADREAMNLRKRSDFRQDKEVTALLQGKVSYIRKFLRISMGLLVKKN